MSAAVSNELLLRQLHWRYATKKFDTTRKISDENWTTLEQTLLLSPSSGGLQPWKFIVVKNPAVRAKLREHAFGQAQITDASHLVVFAYNKRFAPSDVERFINRTAEVRNATVESLDGLKNMLLGVAARPEADRSVWASRQPYIALGMFLSAAAMLEIDACPMEGFDSAKFDEVLGLDALGYASVAVAAAGYRAADDKYAGAKKVRFAANDVIVNVD